MYSQMWSFRFSLAIVLAVFLTGNAGANHIRTGKVSMDGKVKTSEGFRHYTTDAFLIKPIVCWEDLVKDRFTVDHCTADKLRFVGNIDADDFKKGIVLTFPVKDYLKFGCPLPPRNSNDKAPQVIFRKIESVKLGNGKATAHTSFIDPGDVVPTIEVHIGELLKPSRQIVGNSVTKDMDLTTSARVNNIGVTGFQRRGSFSLLSAVTIAYSMTASGGICNFRFDVPGRQVTWEQRIDVTADATVTGTVGFSRSASGEIFKVAIPGAGFSFNIFLLGRVSAGFTAALDWEADINVGAAASARFTARVSAGRRIELGIGRLSNSPILSTNSGLSASINFNTVTSATAFANGFVGVRPILAAEFEFPLVPDAGVGLGATVGLAPDVVASSIPFPPVSGGLGSACSTCHLVQGSLDVEGRRLSVTVEPSIGGRGEFLIDENLFSNRIGTTCFFSVPCI